MDSVRCDYDKTVGNISCDKTGGNISCDMTVGNKVEIGLWRNTHCDHKMSEKYQLWLQYETSYNCDMAVKCKLLTMTVGNTSSEHDETN